jgi:SAM-dependent methyltransferase
LKDKTDFFHAPLKMLHIAPELCFIKKFNQIDSLEYISGDIESPLAEVKMDIHNIPFEENTFDVIFCNHVLEHVDDDIKAMSEMYRVLKPGGWAILQVPFFYPMEEETFEDERITDPHDRAIAFGQEDHVRMYGKDYPQRIAGVGFEVVEDRYVFELGSDTVDRFALPSNEIIHRANKPAHA